jgi:hypothetical protein
MKNLTFFILGLFCLLKAANAQVFSYKKISDGIKEGEKKENVRNIITQITKDSIAGNFKYKQIINDFEKQIADSVEYYENLRLRTLKDDNIKDKNSKIGVLNAYLDTFIKSRQNLISQAKYYGILEDYRNRKFFPAYFSSQAIEFFESDTTHQKLFQNNLVNYNPNSKKMTLYTEAVNDYLGPLRIGIGFQISSESVVDSLSTIDSTKKLEKRDDLISALQSGGGDISINAQLPLIKTNNTSALIQSRFYLYGNSGFSLPIINKASDDFIFNYSMGVEGAFYARGFNNKITFFAQLKGGYYNGNNNYKQVIKSANAEDPTSFGLFQSSFGLDFSGGYRIKVDLYNGNSFVRKNFPATITFIVKPGNK